MLVTYLFLLVLAAMSRAETSYFGNSCIVVYGNVVDGVVQPGDVSGNFQLQGYCGLNDLVTIPCTEANLQCKPTDCECFGIAGNGAASMAGAATTAGAALIALFV